ncbi:MAG: T9SS type A sorting domain-containing protein [Flavobacteriales bacterium]|nr:T9SS type A sorting domain-containing protein [Flavobacteriales bacterium]MCC6937556.1 T9SS type A sorting domain-containing protein [Flavobacteriales bacterium]
MQIRTLFSIAFVCSSMLVMAQPCTPNPLYADSVFGVWPDTTENFMPAMINLPYVQDLNLIIPVSAQDINITFPAVDIDSVVFNGITGLPAGLSVACASQTPAPCTYLPTVLGCGVITGTPTEAGTFPLALDVTGYFTLFGTAVPYPLTFGGYRIVVAEDNTGIHGIGSTGLSGVKSVPNPFTTRTNLEFSLQRGGEVKLHVYNLLGEQLWSQRTVGKAGMNKIPFEAGELQEGVYLFKVESGTESFTGRLMVSR